MAGRPSGYGIVLCAAWLTLLGATGAPAEEPPTRVTCRVPGDPDARVFRLQREGSGWSLAWQSRETRDEWIVLALPRAQPALTATHATLSYRNANGGRQVSLSATPDRATLDVWVDHGLEVNIEPDLDPRVDLMNTDGPREVRCAIGS